MHLAIILNKEETSKFIRVYAIDEDNSTDTIEILSEIFHWFDRDHISKDYNWFLYGTGNCGNVYLLEENIFI